jgi:transposase
MSKIKDETVVEILMRVKQGESPAKLAREYEVGLTTIKRWRRGTQRVGKDFDPELVLDPDKRIKRLEEKVEDLRTLLDQALGLKKLEEDN